MSNIESTGKKIVSPLDFKFAEFDLGSEIGIKISNKYVIQFVLPDDFHPAHRAIMNHLLGLVASGVNHLPQIVKDGLLHRYFGKDKIPNQSDGHTKGLSFRLSDMDEGIQGICQCPILSGQGCFSGTIQIHGHELCKARKKPNTLL